MINSTQDKMSFKDPFSEGHRNVEAPKDSLKPQNSQPSHSISNRKHSQLHTSTGEPIKAPENEALEEGEKEPEPDVVETGKAIEGGRGPHRGSLAGDIPDNSNPWSKGTF